MKNRKILFCIIFIVVMSFATLIWYEIDVKLLDLDASQVSEISVFNGNTGEELSITDSNDIEHIINNLNSISLNRDKISFGYAGYSFDMKIILEGREEAKNKHCFIINSEDLIRKGLFFYTLGEEKIDYSYIEDLFNQ